jgi:hypothetical protein
MWMGSLGLSEGLAGQTRSDIYLPVKMREHLAQLLLMRRAGASGGQPAFTADRLQALFEDARVDGVAS